MPTTVIQTNKTSLDCWRYSCQGWHFRTVCKTAAVWENGLNVFWNNISVFQSFKRTVSTIWAILLWKTYALSAIKNEKL